MVDESDYHHHDSSIRHTNDDHNNNNTTSRHSSSTQPDTTTTTRPSNVDDDDETKLQYSDMMYAIDSFYTIVQPGTCCVYGTYIRVYDWRCGYLMEHCRD